MPASQDRRDADAGTDAPASLAWSDVGRAGGRFWWLLVIGVIVALGGVGLRVSQSPAVYRSSMSVVFAPTPTLDPFDSIEALRALDSATMQATFSEIASSDATRAAALGSANVIASSDGEYVVDAVIAQEANVVELSVTGSDAESATAVVNAVSDDSIARFTALYPMYDITVLTPPEVPDEPEPSDTVTNVVLAVAATTVIWTCLAVLLDRAVPRRGSLGVKESGASGDDDDAPSDPS